MSMELRIVDGANTPEFVDSVTGEQLSVDGELIVRGFEAESELGRTLIKQTDFADKYLINGANVAVLKRVATKLNRHRPNPDALTESRLFEAYRVADELHGVCGECGTLERLPERKPLTAVRDENGRYQNELVNQFEEMLKDPTVSAASISARMKNDRAFREAVQSTSEQKPQPEPIVSEEQRARAREFAAAFRREPNPRFLGGFVKIGNREYSREEYEARIDEAVNLGEL